MKRKISAILAALGLAAALVVVAAAPAQATVYWNCASGVACVWSGANGTGTKVTISVGTYGTNTCWTFTSAFNDVLSSASADFGSGYDLVLYKDAGCANGFWSINTQVVYSPNSESYGGEYFNDIASSFEIMIAPQ